MSAGSRLALRALTAPDARRSLAGDAPLSFVAGYPSTFATEVLRFVAAYQAEPGNGVNGCAPDLGPWWMIRRCDETVVGTMSCGWLAEDSAVSVGYEVAPCCQGQGYATEALRLLVAYLLDQPDVRRVRADTTVAHPASRRVLEKAGFRWRRDQVDVLDGREVVLAHYAIDGPARRPAASTLGSRVTDHGGPVLG